MATSKGKGDDDGPRVNLEDEVDGLFKLPLSEFTAARNVLAARLKKAGRGAEAARVKALARPSVSAWAVNQLYWRQRREFEALMSAGEQFVQAHAAQLAGKAVDPRVPLAGRREAVSVLTRLADALLRDAGHSPAPDTMHRIATTLEALSTNSSLYQPPGRLTGDVAPPGFESLAALIPSAGKVERPEPSRVVPFAKPASAGVRKRELDKARLASAKAALQAAELTLQEKHTIAEDAAAAVRKATAHADEAEKARREAAERLEKASAAAEEAARTLKDAERRVEEARKAFQDEAD